MKKLQLAAAVLATAGLVACASFGTNAFRTEQATVNLAYTAYVGWTNFLTTPEGLKVNAAQSNAVKQTRLRFAESLVAVEHLRTTFATNSAVQPDYQAALTSLQSNAGELVALIAQLKGQTP